MLLCFNFFYLFDNFNIAWSGGNLTKFILLGHKNVIMFSNLSSSPSLGYLHNCP